MGTRHIITLSNLLLSGTLALLITLFFVGGAILNTKADLGLEPEYFVILFIWGIGATFGFLQFLKNLVRYFVLSLFTTWASIPLGVYLGYIMAK
ncbi:hypothetical protein [Oceanobacillus kapialis]|uniref:Uncharacterized protein n=1 Tax=Oceanobacillus kapialis TaxID=481353 RepID=A0ABW5Q2N5_9BACI